MTDVNHPDYYEIETRRGKIECQDLIQALTYELKGDLAYWDGCFIKYGFRWNRKHKDLDGKLQDLKKARVCLDRMIDIVSLDYNFPINPYGVETVPCSDAGKYVDRSTITTKKADEKQYVNSHADTTSASDEEIGNVVEQLWNDYLKFNKGKK